MPTSRFGAGALREEPQANSRVQQQRHQAQLKKTVGGLGILPASFAGGNVKIVAAK
jgi:hypothetical protein